MKAGRMNMKWPIMTMKSTENLWMMGWNCRKRHVPPCAYCGARSGTHEAMSCSGRLWAVATWCIRHSQCKWDISTIFINFPHFVFHISQFKHVQRCSKMLKHTMHSGATGSHSNLCCREHGGPNHNPGALWLCHGIMQHLKAIWFPGHGGFAEKGRLTMPYVKKNYAINSA